jgi:hypothetical protein
MTRGEAHPLAVIAIKAVHTAIFFAELSAILWLVISGMRGRRDRSVAVASGLVAIEAAVFVANDGVCPLTPLTERLGAARGSVSDIFLPHAVARTIPTWSTALLVLAGLLHARSVLAEPRPTPKRGARTGEWEGAGHASSVSGSPKSGDDRGAPGA